MSNDTWARVVKGLARDQDDVDPSTPEWVLYYHDGDRKVVISHSESNLENVLQAFEDFCKGCGFVFDGFEIVDSDGIPVKGLHPLAKLENSDT